MGKRAAGRPEEFARAVNAEVKAEMARRTPSVSNRKLAEAIGVSNDYVNKRISNKTPWDLHDLEMLGREFGLMPEAFVDRAVIRLNEEASRPLAVSRSSAVPDRGRREQGPVAP